MRVSYTLVCSPRPIVRVPNEAVGKEIGTWETEIGRERERERGRGRGGREGKGEGVVKDACYDRGAPLLFWGFLRMGA